MVLRLNGNLSIDNLRHYPAEVVDELRTLLAGGALAHADPHRDNFYELDSGSRMFYIHVSPRGSKVLLLAAWRKTAPQELERAAD
jgi:hypothetical protein